MLRRFDHVCKHISCSNNNNDCVIDEWSRYNDYTGNDDIRTDFWTNNRRTIHNDQWTRCQLLLSLLLPFLHDLHILWWKHFELRLRVRQRPSCRSNSCRSRHPQVRGSGSAERQFVSGTTCSTRGFCQERTTNRDSCSFANQPKGRSWLQGNRYVASLSVRPDSVRH